MGERYKDGKESLRREREKEPGFLKRLKKKIKKLRNRDENIYPLWFRLRYKERRTGILFIDSNMMER